MKLKLLLYGMLVLSTTVFAKDHDNSIALKNAVILIIRHAEKPDSGYSLSPIGEERAHTYVNYFKNYTVDSRPLKLDYLFCAADSRDSHRPRLTIEPLSNATGLAIDDQFKDRQFQQLADEIKSRPHGKNILICWHHEEIPALLHSLGADPRQVIPNAKWPGDVFGWLIQLRYDSDGHLIGVKRINENLMPDDSNKHALK